MHRGIADNPRNKSAQTWERQAQKSGEVEKDRVLLNLQLNQEGLLECWGRLQGDYPVYLSETSES